MRFRMAVPLGSMISTCGMRTGQICGIRKKGKQYVKHCVYHALTMIKVHPTCEYTSIISSQTECGLEPQLFVSRHSEKVRACGKIAKSILPTRKLPIAKRYLIVLGADHQRANRARGLRVLLQRLHARHHRLLRRRRRTVRFDKRAAASDTYNTCEY